MTIALAASVLGAASGAGPSLPKVRLQTTLGAIVIEVDTVHAPISGRNFLRYVDAGLYQRGFFHRAVHLRNQPQSPVKIEVIQASADTTRSAQFFGTIPLERTTVTGLRHYAGTVSLARREPDSAEDNFFICVTDQPELDFGGKRNPDGQGFAAFGRVLTGMDVVRRIQRAPVVGQRLTPLVPITSAGRIP